MEAFQDATQDAYGYLLLDLKPTTSETLRIRTGILPNDVQLVYIHGEKNVKSSV